MNHQIIKSPSGDELVVVPKAEYDALVSAAAANDAEDLADAAVYLARKAALGANGTLPPDVSAAILRGEKMRAAIRKWRGLTQVDLAARVGVTQGALSDIESGRRAPSKELAGKLAAALDVPVQWID